MRTGICFILFFNLIIAKDVRFKIQNSNALPRNFVSVNGSTIESPPSFDNLRNFRNDTSTVWLEDFESDLSEWELDDEWELTEESSSSPTHSMRFDDDYINAYSLMVSPLISLPEIRILSS